MNDRATTSAPTPRRRSRWRRLVVALLCVASLGLVAAEAFLRVRYGLGDPPVQISDEATEYRMSPRREYRRLGNRMSINDYSMRSDPFPRVKPRPTQRRVLVIGDSVMFGGAQTDQADLATSILQAHLRRELAPTAIVGNASAGSWGPQNMLGYVEAFGLFDADVVVIVLSSHDAFDEMSAAATPPGVPSRTYWFALSEAWDRLRPPATASAAPVASSDGPTPNHRGASGPCLAALGALIERVREAGATPIVALHYERPELDAPAENEGHRLIRATCAARGVEPISLAPALRAAIAAGQSPYRDDIHPNEAGQRAVAEALAGPIIERLRAGGPTRP